MKISRIFTIIIITDCITLALLYYLFAIPVSYKEYRGDGFSCMVPADSDAEIFQEFDWHKHYFSKKGEIYISHYWFDGTFEEELTKLRKHLKGTAFEQEVKIFDNGWFFLYAKGRAWRRYIYLFSYEKEIFWVENLCRTSTLSTYKEVADKIITTMKIKGRSTDISLPATIADINKKIVRHTQSPDLFLSILGAILLATTLLFPALLFYLGGAIPASGLNTILRKERWVYVTIRAKLKYKGTFGSLVLTPEGLTLYYFKKPLLSILRGEGDKVSLEEKKGKVFLALEEEKHFFSIYVADPHLWINDIRSQLSD